ncbi:stress responsive A/B barrel domain protein [Diplocarpon mali]|nr:stress responsive A/B barrel domain protein [Diplocarpon mali]
MLALRQTCLYPTSKEPYIVDSTGGRDNSPEGHQGAFSHAFVTHFKNEEDRRYYLEEDPAHRAFVESLKGVIQNVRVVDYSPGVF